MPSPQCFHSIDHGALPCKNFSSRERKLWFLYSFGERDSIDLNKGESVMHAQEFCCYNWRKGFTVFADEDVIQTVFYMAFFTSNNDISIDFSCRQNSNISSRICLYFFQGAVVQLFFLKKDKPAVGLFSLEVYCEEVSKSAKLHYLRLLFLFQAWSENF